MGAGQDAAETTHVFHAEYFDGKTTIVVTSGSFDKRFDLERSPLTRAGLADRRRRT